MTRMVAVGPPLTPEEKQRQFDCQQCMQLAFAEVARLVEGAPDGLDKAGALAIIRDWAETRVKQSRRGLR